MVSTYHPENAGKKKDAVAVISQEKRNSRMINDRSNKNKFKTDIVDGQRVAAISVSKPISAEPVSAMMRNVSKIG